MDIADQKSETNKPTKIKSIKDKTYIQTDKSWVKNNPVELSWIESKYQRIASINNARMSCSYLPPGNLPQTR